MQVVDISGKVDLEFQLAEELNLSDDYSKEIVFEVVVEEEKTQRRQNNTASLTLYKHPYKLELVRTADAFKPGMPYTAFLKLAHQDGRPVLDDLNPVSWCWTWLVFGLSYYRVILQVSVKAGFGSDPSQYEATEYQVPANGIVRLAFVAPEDPALAILGIEAR